MSLQKQPARLNKQPSNPKSPIFDYATLNLETRIVVQQRTSEIKSLMRHTASDIFDIGQKLTEVKAQLGHGYFRDWLKTEFDWSFWTANKYMQVATKFKCVNFLHLDIAVSALYELAAPSTPSAAFDEAIERAALGEAITYSKAKAIKAKALTQYGQEPIQSQPSSVTIDVPAQTIERELSLERGTQTKPSRPPTASISNPQSGVFGQKQTANDLRLGSTVEQAPPKVERHHSLPMDVDDPIDVTTKRLDIAPDALASSGFLYVENLSHEQIEALWQALAHCTSLEKLALHNWSNSQLKRLNTAVNQELNQRCHHMAQL
ncbi:MAG: DUF3102 domain-containing protein [Gloeocapsa sp. UFS-A4-WI-NPMV-4B04]|jgi:hypothetical protein|nr:DUF3102 domain-containing protein [Gloeocapsa sp. UFS-A4-WI-NPMV-4B04]